MFCQLDMDKTHLFRAANMWYAFQDNRSGQTIATSHDLGLQNGGLVREIPGYFKEI